MSHETKPALDLAPNVGAVALVEHTGNSQHDLARAAVRCSECHAEITDDWAEGAHAKSATSPVYLAMKKDSQAVGCESCHAPLAAQLDTRLPVVKEGVTCDVCHNVAKVHTDSKHGTDVPYLEMRLGSDTKYGPYCDAEDHYFHRMGCSPQHSESAFCGGCHQWSLDVAGGHALPVKTEYAEWAAGPYAEMEMTCQGCHMPGKKGETAVGWEQRTAISTHGLFAAAPALRRTAISARIDVEARDGDRLGIHIELENDGAGHYVPSGLPARRLELVVTTVSADGSVMDRHVRSYGRVLVDERGQVVPFYLAKSVREDTRIGPEQTAEADVELAAPSDGQLEMTLNWVELSEEVATRLGVESRREELLSTKLAFGPPAKRRKLPRAVELKP